MNESIPIWNGAHDAPALGGWAKIKFREIGGIAGDQDLPTFDAGGVACVQAKIQASSSAASATMACKSAQSPVLTLHNENVRLDMYNTCNQSNRCPSGYTYRSFDWLKPWNYAPYAVGVGAASVGVMVDEDTFDFRTCSKPGPLVAVAAQHVWQVAGVEPKGENHES